MKSIIKTEFEGLFIIKNEIYIDQRGSFQEVYRSDIYKNEIGVHDFVQQNLSRSKKGVLRGLHFQKGAFSQKKLLTLVDGAIFDVVVDLRPEEKTFRKNFSIELKAGVQMLIPKGFAHGFLAMEESLVSYLTDQYYKPEEELGIHYLDPEIGINWPELGMDLIISEKDSKLPRLEEIYDHLGNW